MTAIFQSSYTESIIKSASQHTQKNGWQARARGTLALASLSSILDALKELCSMTREGACLAAGTCIRHIPLETTRQWGQHLVQSRSLSHLQRSSRKVAEMIVGGQKIAFMGVRNPQQITERKVEGMRQTLINAPKGRKEKAFDALTTKNMLATYAGIATLGCLYAALYSMQSGIPFLGNSETYLNNPNHSDTFTAAPSPTLSAFTSTSSLTPSASITEMLSNSTSPSPMLSASTSWPAPFPSITKIPTNSASTSVSTAEVSALGTNNALINSNEYSKGYTNQMDVTEVPRDYQILENENSALNWAQSMIDHEDNDCVVDDSAALEVVNDQCRFDVDSNEMSLDEQLLDA